MKTSNFTKLFLILILSLFFVSCTANNPLVTQTSKANAELEHTDPDGYWTCPMHPQVHKHEKGACPICGMALVHVKGKTSTSQQVVELTEVQIQNTQISKYTVVKKDVFVSVPVAGRVMSSREISFQVYESDLTIIKIGSEFIGASTTSPDKKVKGRITRIDNLVDPSSRTIRITGELSEPLSPLVLESGFYGDIQTQLKNQIVIPEEALFFSGTKALVYFFSTDNKLEAREVAVGIKAQKEYQILSGLRVGDVISGSANFLLDSEAKIKGP